MLICQARQLCNQPNYKNYNDQAPLEIMRPNSEPPEIPLEHNNTVSTVVLRVQRGLSIRPP